MRGKKKCELLKSIRCKIAKQNGIEYTLSECTFQGECKGTCPKCEAELRQLTNDLKKIRQSGKRVAIAGIAAAMVAASATSCTPKETDEWEVLDHDSTGFTAKDPENVVEELTGDYDVNYQDEYADGEFPADHLEGKIAIEPYELDGDIYIPESEEE